MNWKLTSIMVGMALFIEGVFFTIDWSLLGIPSLFIGGIHVHHWMVGLLLMLAGLVGLYK